MTSSIWQSITTQHTRVHNYYFYGVKNQTLKPFSFCLQSKCKGIWIIYYLYKKNTVISSHWHVCAHKATTIIVDGFIFTSQRYTILIPKSSGLHWNTRSYKELWTSKKETLQQTYSIYKWYLYFFPTYERTIFQ